MRKLAVVVLVLVVLALIGDEVARRIAEDRASEEIGRAIEFEGDAQVRLEGWPFLPSVLSGRLSSVVVAADTVTARGVTLEDVEITLDDVTFELSDVLSGDAESISARSGVGRASLTEDVLDAALRSRDAPFEASLDDAGVAVTSDRVPGEARADLLVEGDFLVVAPPAPLAPVRIRLPGLADGVVYESVEVGARRATLSFSLRGDALRLGGSR